MARLYRKQQSPTPSAQAASHALTTRWMGHLIAAWRDLTGAPGGASALTHAEIARVAGGIGRLSRGLTDARGLIGVDYMSEPDLLGAYLLFYWPVSYAQAHITLAQLPAGFKPASVLDLGAGPAPVAMAAWDRWGAPARATDRSARALNVARALASAAGASLTTQTLDLSEPRASIPTGASLITMSHALNELWAREPDAAQRRAALAERALEALAPGGHLVIMEPALRETSRGLLQVRDLLVEQGAAVVAPCLYQGACPALERERDWCHGEHLWQAPALVSALSDAAKLHKTSLKLSYLIVRRGAWPDAPRASAWRVVSEPLHTRGRLSYIMCGPDGRAHLTLLERELGEHNEAFALLPRGAVITIDGELEVRGDGLRLQGFAPVTVLAAPDAPLP